MIFPCIKHIFPLKPPFVRTSMCKGFPIEITIYQKTIYIYMYCLHLQMNPCFPIRRGSACGTNTSRLGAPPPTNNSWGVMGPFGNGLIPLGKLGKSTGNIRKPWITMVSKKIWGQNGKAWKIYWKVWFLLQISPNKLHTPILQIWNITSMNRPSGFQVRYKT